MIQLNGKQVCLKEQEETYAPGVSLTEFLKAHAFVPERIAVELNMEILTRDTYETTILHDGDVLEVVHFMGGGCCIKNRKEDGYNA